jgi:hypothetical protein
LARTLYTQLWSSKEIRSLILGVLLLSMMFLLELIFLFFPNDLQQSFLAILFLEFPLLGGTFTPLLTIFHLITWGLMFFSSLIVYSIIREYTGGRTGLIEIAGIIVILVYDAWFALFFVGVSVVIVGYMYFILVE